MEKVIIGITLGIIIILIIFVLYNRFKYKRSFTASIVELYLRLTKEKINQEKLNRKIEKAKQEKKVIPHPKIKFRSSIREEMWENMQVFFLGDNPNKKQVIIYLHGGAYFRKPRKQHWRFIKTIEEKTKTNIVFPIYLKVPNHSYKESYDLLTSLYLKLKLEYQNIILMGDSSGGGLALGLCEDFLIKKIKLPKKLILLSPWVDVSLKNPMVKKFEKVDPLINTMECRSYGELWANNTSIKDYHISPIYGNMIGLSETIIFVGKRELLYPDIKLLYSTMTDSKVKVTLFEKEGMNHVYPIYPIYEAKEAINQICLIIKENENAI